MCLPLTVFPISTCRHKLWPGVLGQWIPPCILALVLYALGLSISDEGLLLTPLIFLRVTANKVSYDIVSLMDPLFRIRDLMLFSLFFTLCCPSIVFTICLKGFGYVTFKDKDGLLKALKMTGLNLSGRNLRVEVAKPQRGGNRRGESS